MRKMAGRIGICFLAAAVFWTAALVLDRVRLRRELIRLHVVAASDSDGDQALKLRVRDAVTDSLRQELENLTDANQAKEYLQTQLPKIEELAKQVLREAGCEDSVSVSLAMEEFGSRVYDTFSLPSGVYNALRIVIGEGEGKNWWCVVFPGLCGGDASDFESAAAGAGFSEELTETLEKEAGYEIRFFLLDALGRLENLLRAD